MNSAWDVRGFGIHVLALVFIGMILAGLASGGPVATAGAAHQRSAPAAKATPTASVSGGTSATSGNPSPGSVSATTSGNPSPGLPVTGGGHGTQDPLAPIGLFGLIAVLVGRGLRRWRH